MSSTQNAPISSIHWFLENLRVTQQWKRHNLIRVFLPLVSSAPRWNMIRALWCCKAIINLLRSWNVWNNNLVLFYVWWILVELCWVSEFRIIVANIPFLKSRISFLRWWTFSAELCDYSVWPCNFSLFSS